LESITSQPIAVAHLITPLGIASRQVE